MADISCCSCKLARYEIDEDDSGTIIICSKGHEITERMIIDDNCNEYIRRTIL